LIIKVRGEAIQEFIPQIAKLRIEVFAEYPFLYQGDYESEEGYLKKFAASDEAVIVVAHEGNEVIGAATGCPFRDASDNVKEPFLIHHRNPSDYFYFGDLVILKAYRGRGIGRRFFEELEKHVASLGHYQYSCLFTINKPLDDPKRPKDYRSLSPFFKKAGFKEHPELTCSISYKEEGDDQKTPKEMVFWIKE
jgi:GNAT superfamily N-acetyltransferase